MYWATLFCCVSLTARTTWHTETTIEKKRRVDVKVSRGCAWGMPRPPAGQKAQCAHRPWRPLPGASTPHRALSADAALAHRLAELDEVVLSGPAHPPDPGPDVRPARADVSFVSKIGWPIAKDWRTAGKKYHPIRLQVRCSCTGPIPSCGPGPGCSLAAPARARPRAACPS